MTQILKFRLKSGLALAALLSAAQLPAAAWAQCPTQADLAGGIAVADVDGYIETFYSHGPNMIRVETRDDTDSGTQILSGYGTYWVQAIDIFEGKMMPDSRTTYVYPLAPKDMPEPTPGGAWHVEVVTTGYDEINTEVQSISFGERTTITVGACSYDAIGVVIDFAEEDYLENLHYLPELGFSLLANTVEGDEEPSVFHYTSIEKAG